MTALELPPALAALSALRQRIADAPQGARLPPERQLAEELGIGRRAIRQALDRLEREGAIWRHQGQGTFVGAPPSGRLSDRVSPVQVMEARLVIEPELARLAAIHATRTNVENLRRAAAAVNETTSASDYEKADIGFHRLIAEIAGNPLLLEMLDTVLDVRRRADWTLMREASHTAERASRFVAAHAAILTAISSRDPIAAEAAMRQHLRDVAVHSVGMDPGPATTPDH
ncbi:FadR/GntR family transcriptional regulator [Devosia sp.]|uniref:FadR/GntR family transcriptional regulator n=1 Tax=Devosia sp. TaxID=1871048 RepID=UPI003A94A97C